MTRSGKRDRVDETAEMGDRGTGLRVERVEDEQHEPGLAEGRKEGRSPEGRVPHLPSSNVDTRQRLERIGSTNLECVLQV